MRLFACYLLCICIVALPGCGSNEPGPEPGELTTEPETTSVEPVPPVPDRNQSDSKPAPPPPAANGNTVGMGSMPMTFPKPEDMKFNDDVQSNVAPPVGLKGLIFVDTNNNRVRLADYVGKKHVVLVFTEGFAGMLCPFCKTQTARLVANYDKFKALDAEILVVYPGERDHVDEFILAAQGVDKEQVDDVPFPIVLDSKMEAVDYFDIRSKLAHPSTYVIDKQGNVQLAYVGDDMSPDRPSIKALLRTLQTAQDRK